MGIKGAKDLSAMGAISVVLSLLGTPSLTGQIPPYSEEELEAFEGDYEVDVYPQAFGFKVIEGTLHLLMGGREGGGTPAPLILDEERRFVLSEGHPNAFGFVVDEGTVRFTLYSAGNPIPGKRIGDPAPGPQPEGPSRPLRANVQDDLIAATRRLEAAPNDEAGRYEVAKLMLASGEFWAARDLLAGLAQTAGASAEVVALAAEAEYLVGNYKTSERLFGRAIELTSGNPTAATLAKLGLLFTYYQQDRFAAARTIEFPEGVQLPTADLMASFTADPYAMSWHGERRSTELPMLQVDPLPVVRAQINGVTVNLLLDTGADLLILDEPLANQLGVEPVATAMGTFGGGRRAEVGFGAVKHLDLGDVEIERVPIMTLPTRRFTMGPDSIDGILGTAVLRQFLSTIDYGNHRIVLRDRSPESARLLRADLDGRSVEIPYVMAATHLMMARGKINHGSDLTFFIDSGLASNAVLTAPKQTLEHLGIPEPETALDESSVGGGGGQFATGSFALDRVALGPLEQTDVTGSYGERPPDTYWHRDEFIVDALLSHSFFKRYSSWTLDFDSMTYLFAVSADGS